MLDQEIDIFGEKKRVTCLGHGSWTTAYKSGKLVYLFTERGDRSKSLACLFPKMKHLPEVIYLGTDADGLKVYKSKYYKPIQSETTASRYQKVLNKHFSYCPYNFDRSWLQTKLDSCRIPKSLKKAITFLGNVCIEEGYTLEFQRFNLGTDKDGSLVLLDSMYPIHDRDSQ